MTINLPPDLARDLEAEVSAGRAPSVDSLVASAMRAHLGRMEQLRRTLDEAEADYAAHGGIPFETVRAELVQLIAEHGR